MPSCSSHDFSRAAVIAVMMGFGPLTRIQSGEQTNAGASLTQNAPPAPAPGFKLPRIKNTAFKAGEKLHYDIFYQGITVGHASIEVAIGPLLNGRPTITYRSQARSTPFFDVFFRVRDESGSTADKASLFSLSFDQNLHEGDYRAVRHYKFDYRRRKFTSEEQTKKGDIKKIEGPLKAPLFDVLSAMYFVRTLNFASERESSLSIFRNNDRVKLPIKVSSLTTDQKTPFGTLSCRRVEPSIEGDSLFRSKGGQLVVWMTNDERKLPVLMEAHASVGAVRVKLMKWEN